MTVNSIQFINVILGKQNFPPCHQAPLACKRVHSFAAGFNSNETQGKREHINVPPSIGVTISTNFEETDKWRLTTLPVSTASTSFVFQCLAMFSESGSSGFGALRSAWMLSKKQSQQLQYYQFQLFSRKKNIYLKSVLNNTNSYIVAFSKGISIFPNFIVSQS